MTALILPFDRITPDDLPHVGGKGLHLGEMARAGLPVPPGFCITTTAFRRFMTATGQSDPIYTTLESLTRGDLDQTRHIGAHVRERLTKAPIPDDIAQAILHAYRQQGPTHSYAVRSSATAEDLPHASFAGQQDTYLNIRGETALLDRVRACWASLFTDRAILYRIEQGFSHRDVALSVVVQRMVNPRASGILFTADPISGHRGITSIDAGFGLGEALVSGLIDADLYRVDKRRHAIVEIRVGDKSLAIEPLPEGGTRQRQLTGDERKAQVLRESEILDLTALGARVEEHYGAPQDIEWCFEEDRLFVVQARPITSLFPLPEPRPKDPGLHVYISFGHAQVMTDPMPPMALSIWRTVFPFGRDDDTGQPNPLMTTAGNRLYLDPTPLLRIPLLRRALPRLLSIADQAISDAVAEVVVREDFEQGARDPARRARIGNALRWLLPVLARVPDRLFITPPEGTAASLWQRFAAHIESEAAAIAKAPPGAERLRTARGALMRIFERAIWVAPPLIVASIFAGKILTALVHDETTARDLEAIARGLDGNVTTEMDLAVGDLADAARRSPALAARLAEGTAALERAESLDGGEAFMKAWRAFLSRYGMRGPSEIDISRPRYRDDPSAILMAVVGNLQHEAPGAHRAHHQRMAKESEAAGARLVAAAQRGIAGAVKGALAGRMVRVVRHLSPVREHPKLLLINIIDLTRQAILEAADTLLAEGRIDARGDVWFLDLDELIAACEQKSMNLRETIAARRADFEHFRRVSPPRVMTSEGEIVKARPRGAHLPHGALAGTAASAGVAEGRARVILDPTREVLGAGEILVAPFTDPGWTPLFINAKALVMEVGGLMTHGSVVAREYGIPAVVSVEGATQRIKSGQRIRVDGDLGCVEILADEAAKAASGAT